MRRPVARQALANAKPFLSSECPLAGMHILQGMQIQAKGAAVPGRALHPIELFARAYGIEGEWSDEGVKRPLPASEPPA